MYNDSYLTFSYVSESSTKTIYYDKNNPAIMKITISPSCGILLAIFGITSGAIGLVMIFYKPSKVGRKRKC